MQQGDGRLYQAVRSMQQGDGRLYQAVRSMQQGDGRPYQAVRSMQQGDGRPYQGILFSSDALLYKAERKNSFKTQKLRLTE